MEYKCTKENIYFLYYNLANIAIHCWRRVITLVVVAEVFSIFLFFLFGFLYLQLLSVLFVSFFFLKMAIFSFCFIGCMIKDAESEASFQYLISLHFPKSSNFVLFCLLEISLQRFRGFSFEEAEGSLAPKMYFDLFSLVQF